MDVVSWCEKSNQCRDLNVCSVIYRQQVAVHDL